MNHPEEMDLMEAPRVIAGSRPDLRVVGEQPRPPAREARVVGSPLPVGSNGQNYRSAPPPGRSLAPSAEADSHQRAMGVLNAAMPFVQKLLPLIDGNLANSIAGFFGSRPHSSPSSAPVDLTPVQTQVSELHLQQLDLRTQVVEQTVTLKRFQDQLEMVREATDRNTLEQQELIEDLKAVGNKVNLFAVLLFGLLIISVLLNLVLFLHLKQVFP